MSKKPILGSNPRAMEPVDRAALGKLFPEFSATGVSLRGLGRALWTVRKPTPTWRDIWFYSRVWPDQVPLRTAHEGWSKLITEASLRVRGAGIEFETSITWRKVAELLGVAEDVTGPEKARVTRLQTALLGGADDRCYTWRELLVWADEHPGSVRRGVGEQNWADALAQARRVEAARSQRVLDPADQLMTANALRLALSPSFPGVVEGGGASQLERAIRGLVGTGDLSPSWRGFLFFCLSNIAGSKLPVPSEIETQPEIFGVNTHPVLVNPR